MHHELKNYCGSIQIATLRQGLHWKYNKETFDIELTQYQGEVTVGEGALVIGQILHLLIVDRWEAAFQKINKQTTINYEQKTNTFCQMNVSRCKFNILSFFAWDILALLNAKNLQSCSSRHLEWKSKIWQLHLSNSEWCPKTSIFLLKSKMHSTYNKK